MVSHWLVGLDCSLIEAVVSPFAPHGLGDQTWPVDQNVTIYCQEAPKEKVPVDAEQTVRVAKPRLHEPQHLFGQTQHMTCYLTNVN
jgi:hypothetical protein